MQKKTFLEFKSAPRLEQGWRQTSRADGASHSSRRRSANSASSRESCGCGTAEPWIKEGKNDVKWTRLSCRSFIVNAVRRRLHALAYNLTNFMQTRTLREAVKQWSLTSLWEKLIKIGAKIVRYDRYVIFQMAEVAAATETPGTLHNLPMASGSFRRLLSSTRFRSSSEECRLRSKHARGRLARISTKFATKAGSSDELIGK